jgi:hypothetical protein
MKIVALLVGLVAIAAPSFAQSRVYTNADLGRPLADAARPDAAAAAAILAPYQTVFAPPLPRGPFSVGIYSSPTAGPFGELVLSPSTTRLDGTSLFDYPWALTTYAGRSYGSVYRRSYGGSPGRSAAHASGRSSARAGAQRGRR